MDGCQPQGMETQLALALATPPALAAASPSMKETREVHKREAIGKKRKRAAVRRSWSAFWSMSLVLADSDASWALLSPPPCAHTSTSTCTSTSTSVSASSVRPLSTTAATAVKKCPFSRLFPKKQAETPPFWEASTTSASENLYSTDASDTPQRKSFGLSPLATKSSLLDTNKKHHIESSSPFTICMNQLSVWYDQALTRKCPFLRRRATDLLDWMEECVLRWSSTTTAEQEVQPRLAICSRTSTTAPPQTALSIATIYQILLRHDWKDGDPHRKGYYITGKLSRRIYRDDCYFTGPDPDLPVTGLRKYCDAAGQLFDRPSSWCRLQELVVVENESTIVATWTMQGRLRLPGRPRIPVVHGRTVYRIQDGLIASHEEEWDINVQTAFVETFFPIFTAEWWRERKQRQDAPEQQHQQQRVPTQVPILVTTTADLSRFRNTTGTVHP